MAMQSAHLEKSSGTPATYLMEKSLTSLKCFD